MSIIFYKLIPLVVIARAPHVKIPDKQPEFLLEIFGIKIITSLFQETRKVFLIKKRVQQNSYY